MIKILTLVGSFVILASQAKADPFDIVASIEKGTRPNIQAAIITIKDRNNNDPVTANVRLKWTIFWVKEVNGVKYKKQTESNTIREVLLDQGIMRNHKVVMPNPTNEQLNEVAGYLPTRVLCQLQDGFDYDPSNNKEKRRLSWQFD